ncbi:hypothetical protein [Streptomyces sp. NPDC005077]|uniref:hypothetical protein n=1 Tax=Streptomyces sp. NPDC005077 TaxID=3154292 RepID=UPI0033B38F78
MDGHEDVAVLGIGVDELPSAGRPSHSGVPVHAELPHRSLAGIPVHHFLLHAGQDTLVERIETDTKPESVTARQWRLDHLADYRQSLSWLRRALEVIDTTEITPDRVAEIITSRVRPRGQM